MAIYPNKPVKTVTINYTDPAPGATPQLQILNDVAGNAGEIQFKGKSGNFAATNNLAWDGNSQTLNIRGNIRMTGTIVGNLIGNPTSLKLIGGNVGDVLVTDGTGNLSWQTMQDVGGYGNTEVASYLPTYTGTLKASNANLGNSVTANYILGNLYGVANSSIVADTANSISVANITGIGNIATINKDGNSSNVLYGNGVFAPIGLTYNDLTDTPNLQLYVSKAELDSLIAAYLAANGGNNSINNLDGGNASSTFTSSIDGGEA